MACPVPKDGLPEDPAETESEEPGRGTAIRATWSGSHLTWCRSQEGVADTAGPLAIMSPGTLINFPEPQGPVRHLGTLAHLLGHGKIARREADAWMGKD